MIEASLTWMNVAEAAAYLRVSQPYLNKLRVYGGSPKYSKLWGGKRVIYRRADLDAWAAAGGRASTSTKMERPAS
jgi:excisionase family DNA binding protein